MRPVPLALAEVSPDLQRSNVRSLPAALAPHLRTWRIGTALFGAAALLALLVAAVGLHAVVAFGVRQRELEFSIRRALGDMCREDGVEPRRPTDRSCRMG